MLYSKSLPHIRASLETMNISPAATPDSSTRMISAAISVKPFPLFFACLIRLSPAQTSLISISKRHVARADRRGQVHVLRLIRALENALAHQHDVDLLDQIGRFPSPDRIRLVRIERTAACLVVRVVGKLQVNDVVRHGHWI